MALVFQPAEQGEWKQRDAQVVSTETPTTGDAIVLEQSIECFAAIMQIDVSWIVEKIQCSSHAGEGNRFESGVLDMDKPARLDLA